MRDSIQRVRAVIRGELPDRAPMYDLLRNDAVVSHFAGQTVTTENGHWLTYKAYEPAIDAAEGVLMVGSTTEIHNEVPLENFLAMREAVLDHSYR